MVDRADTNELIERTIEGEESAFGELVERCGRIIESVAFKHGASGYSVDSIGADVLVELAEDLFQKRLKRKKELDEGSVYVTDGEKLRAFVVKRTIYRLLDRRREQKRRLNHEIAECNLGQNDQNQCSTFTYYTDNNNRPEMEAIVNEALEEMENSLDENLRKIFKLYQQGKTNEMIANEMDCHERTIRLKLGQIARMLDLKLSKEVE